MLCQQIRVFALLVPPFVLACIAKLPKLGARQVWQADAYALQGTPSGPYCRDLDPPPAEDAQQQKA